MKLYARVLAALAVVAILYLVPGSVGFAQAALPLVMTLTCKGISQVPTAAVGTPSEHAWIEFEVNDSDNELHLPVGHKVKRFFVRVTEAQKDDFTVGSSYDIDFTVT